MIKKLKEARDDFIKHDPLDENTMDAEDALNICLFMDKVIETFEKLKNILEEENE